MTSQHLPTDAPEMGAILAMRSGIMVIRTFRHLEAWQSAMDLTVACYAVASGLPSDERFVLGNQIRRAAVSVPSNIAEGHATRSDGLLLRHLRIARGSLGELETQIELVVRLKLLPRTALVQALALLIQTRQLLAGLTRAIAGSQTGHLSTKRPEPTADSGKRQAEKPEDGAI